MLTHAFPERRENRCWASHRNILAPAIDSARPDNQQRQQLEADACRVPDRRRMPAAPGRRIGQERIATGAAPNQAGWRAAPLSRR